MNGEPEPTGRPDGLDRAVGTLRVIWLGLLSGAVTVTAVAVAVVASQGPLMDGAGFPVVVAILSLVPLGLIGAFVVAPLLGSAAPPPAMQATEPAPGFFRYQAQFMIRAGLLEGPAIACAIGLMATGEWALLGAGALMLAGLAAIMPTRARVEAFAESASRRADG